ncbi:unnamed protein product [Blumeria hordei]|uniref:Carboxylic ester hydrolase n=2 Tax=Blumeria hordei TaxID=2867405 RepID=A0A383URX8_BLUHO|nr:triacylglycerol lipase [Blumeria hordei DH14]SZF02022.1 unnamed protein product [Blumeria hordei]
MKLLRQILSHFCFVAFAVAFEDCHDCTDFSTTVDLGYARYKGVEIEAGVKYWLGVRFAAAPLGHLRWRAPRDPLECEALQDATMFQPVCIGTARFGNAVQDEDCLFLNIFAPSNATSESRLPVWFYIPGGGYSVNSDANYNATELIKRSGGNVILIQTSYRVSAFGFLASEEIRENGDLNVGFLDQRKALEWVQKYFGGDPDHVVIHGDSAGAGSVALHLTAYGGRDSGLFHSAIMESVFFPTHRKVADYEFQYQNFITLSNCSMDTEPLSCLRKTPLSVLKKANSHFFPFPNATSPPFFPYAPCVDGNIFPDHPAKLYLDGKFLRVPIMIGDDTDEGTSFADNAASPSEVATFMKNQFPKLSNTSLEDINVIYPLLPPMPLHAAYFPSLARAYGEATFTCPGILISQAFYNQAYRSNSAPSIYNYRYNVQDNFLLSVGQGVPHVFELQALFNTFDNATSSYATYNSPIVNVIRDFWINFVRWNNPNGLNIIESSNDSSTGPWAVWANHNDSNPKFRRLLIQTNATKMEDVPELQLLRCQFWKDIMSETEI